jgi:hypothetical protein
VVSWDIPGTAEIGQSGHTSDHNLITTALDQVVKLLPTTYNVVYYGADPTGETSSTSAFEAVQTAIGTSPATIYIPTGTYNTATFLSLVQDQNIIGDGSSSVTINYTGSTTALSINTNGAFNDSYNAGTIKGFSLNGSTATGTPNGIEFGNLQGLVSQDVGVYEFAGIGLYGLDESEAWSEENNIQMILVGNGTAVVLDGSSFDYSNFDFMIVAGPGQGGVYLKSSASLQGCSLRIRGNFYVAATNTASVLALEPQGGSGSSYISNSHLNISVENAPATDATAGYVSHYTLYMGSTSAASQIVGCNGVLSFANVATTSGDATINFQGYYNPNNNPVGFSGVINDTVLGTMQAGDGLAIMGGTDYVMSGAGTSDGLYDNTLYFEFCDIQPFQLASGTNTLTFDGISSGSEGYGKQVVILAKQPSGGGATISWPTNVHFPTAPTVTLSTAANTVTKYIMTYIPDDNVWYAHIAGTGYTA